MHGLHLRLKTMCGNIVGNMPPSTKIVQIISLYAVSKRGAECQ